MDHTLFGEVVGGMEVVDQIVNLPRDSRDNPKDRVEMTINLTQPSIGISIQVLKWIILNLL